MKHRLLPGLLILLLLPLWTRGARFDVMVLESRVLHLGIPGQSEWEDAALRPVDAERMEIPFTASSNSGESTLLIRHRGVKLAWSVVLNG